MHKIGLNADDKKMPVQPQLSNSREPDSTNSSGIVGHWIPVTESMPDDKVTVIIWVGSMNSATVGYHDSDVLARRGDSGWIMAEERKSQRVMKGVTHWCAKVNPPNLLGD